MDQQPLVAGKKMLVLIYSEVVEKQYLNENDVFFPGWYLKFDYGRDNQQLSKDLYQINILPAMDRVDFEF